MRKKKKQEVVVIKEELHPDIYLGDGIDLEDYEPKCFGNTSFIDLAIGSYFQKSYPEIWHEDGNEGATLLRKKLFFRYLVRSRGEIALACSYMGMSRSKLNDWFKNDQEFKSMCAEVKEHAKEIMISQMKKVVYEMYFAKSVAQDSKAVMHAVQYLRFLNDEL